MFSGDGVIMTDGTAKVIEFNDWPGLTWRDYWNLPDTQRRRVKLSRGGEVVDVPMCDNTVDCDGERVYNADTAEVLADLYSLVLGLDSPQIRLADRMREIVPLATVRTMSRRSA
jgi:hypothetical protein